MQKDTGPGVKLPPPIGVLLVIGLAELVQRLLYPLTLETNVNYIIAIACYTLATLLAGLAAWGFKQHKTSIIPHEPDTHLMTGGIFAYSRNPIYLAFLIFQLMFAFVFDNAWQIILLPLSYLFLRYYVIAKEEKYLTDLFGQAYLKYSETVRRWI